MKKISGISAYYHESAAALVIGGKVIAAAREEHFRRQKHAPDFPAKAINFTGMDEAVRKDEELAVEGSLR